MKKVKELCYIFLLIQIGGVFTVALIALLKYLFDSLDIALMATGTVVLINLCALLGYELMNKKSE